MTSQHTAPSAKQLLQVAIATLLVAGCPVAAVWWLRASGTVVSPVLAVLLGMALSLGASGLGCVMWQKQTGSEDLLFSELMIWGFLHRWHTQRRLASALDMVGPLSDAERGALDGLSTKEQAKLLEQLVAGMETRDPYLHGHSRRVARHSWMIARRMGLPREEVARIRTAAAIHDVGKINTPKAILHKAGPLTDEEYEIIKRHPGDGARMVAVLRDADLTSAVRHHHERLDGTGYPDGLRGEEIPLGARIIAVADTFDAITSARPYRPASPHKRAIDILKEEAGTKLDPVVVRAFCGHYAGRGPLALWSFVAGLPERALSWLGSSVATVTSAAKVAAVAALVGGAAVTSATLGLPAGTPHPTKRAVEASGLQALAVRPSVGTRQVLALPAPTPAGRRHGRHAVRRPPARGGSPTRVLGDAQPAGSPGTGAGAGPGSSTGSGLSGHDGNTGGGSGEASPGKGNGGEGSTKGKSEEGSGQGGSGESPAKAKSEEPHGKSEEAHEEAHGKSEEAHEEAHGKSEEAHSKSEEAHGKSEEAHGKSEEAHGKSEVAHGKSEEAHVKAKGE